jgi:hypothetical protein
VARILGTDVDGLSELARAAEAESEISSMCVVFAESEVIGMLARGFPRGDIAAGVVRSIARRAAGLAERVGVRPPVAFTGGVAERGHGGRPGARAARSSGHPSRSASPARLSALHRGPKAGLKASCAKALRRPVEVPSPGSACRT